MENDNYTRSLKSKLLDYHSLIDSTHALEKAKNLYKINRELIENSISPQIFFRKSFVKLLFKNNHFAKAHRECEALFRLLQENNVSAELYQDLILDYVRIGLITDCKIDEIIDNLISQGTWDVLKNNLYTGYIIDLIWMKFYYGRHPIDNESLSGLICYLFNSYDIWGKSISLDSLSRLQRALTYNLEYNKVASIRSPFPEDIQFRFSWDLGKYIFFDDFTRGVEELDHFSKIYAPRIESNGEFKKHYLRSRVDALVNVCRFEEALACCEEYAQYASSVDYTQDIGTVVLAADFLQIRRKLGFSFSESIKWLTDNHLWEAFQTDKSKPWTLHWLVYNYPELLENSAVVNLHDQYRQDAGLEPVVASLKSFEETGRKLNPNYVDPFDSRFKFLT